MHGLQKYLSDQRFRADRQRADLHQDGIKKADAARIQGKEYNNDDKSTDHCS